MWPIIYRILVPGITLSVVAGLISLSSFRALKKGYKGKKTKKIKAEAVVFLMLSLFGLSIALYHSMDLIFKDFVTIQGVYSHYYRGKEIYMREIFFSTDNHDEFCYTFFDRMSDLEPGKQYEIVYAKRTLMMISVHEI